MVTTTRERMILALIAGGYRAEDVAGAIGAEQSEVDAIIAADLARASDDFAHHVGRCTTAAHRRGCDCHGCKRRRAA